MSTLRDERSRQSRELILTAAADLLAERGFRQTSMIDVASRSGVSRGSIPWHFGDKQGLLVAVVDQLLEDWRGAVSATPLPEGSDGARAIARLASTAIRSNTTRLMLALLIEAGPHDSPIHDSLVALHDVFRAHVRKWAELPQVAARLPDGLKSEALAVTVLGTVMGINQQWSLSPERVELEETYDVFTQMLLRLIGSGIAEDELHN